MQYQWPFLKRILSISLLLLMFLCQFGYFAIHAWRQHRLREEFETRLRTGNIPGAKLEILETDLSYRGISWKEKGKECWFQGHLYDVVKMEQKGQSILLYGLPDHQEKRLLETFANNTENNPGSQPNGKAQQLVQFTETDYPDHFIRIPSREPKNEGLLFGDLTPALLKSCPDVMVPPPRC